MHEPEPGPPENPYALRYDRDGRLVVVEAPPPPPPAPTPWTRAILLFVATAASTVLIGGPLYAGAVMFTLLTHEMGHYLQARRYGMTSSLPYFIPMPLPPIGTLGAIIVMRERIRHTRALFDIGISGPLAGLVPTLVFTVIGLRQATVAPIPDGFAWYFGEPLLFRALAHVVVGAVPDGSTIVLGPLGMAGWVGIFITALNLIPIGQLDGGHVLYALLGKRAHAVAVGLLGLWMAAVVLGGYWTWSLFILLLLFFGPKHPPTRDDSVPLGTGRKVLGWLTLAFVIVGFTPTPWWIQGV